MSSQNLNLLPPPLHGLSPREVFIFTGIPLHLVEGFTKGKFKPNPSDREKLSRASLLFYKWSEVEKRLFVERRKYRAVRAFLSLEEKESLFNCLGKISYSKKLDEYIEKYFDQITVAIAGK